MLQTAFGPEPDVDRFAAELRTHGATELTALAVPAKAAELDQALGGLADERLVICADLPGLNLVLHRLLRSGQLEGVDTAVVAQQPIPYLTRAGLPTARSRQLRTAVTGIPRLVGVIKDDSGGVCVDGAELTPWTAGSDWWVRAVVDDQRLADGVVRAVRAWRLGPDELQARVQVGRFTSRTARGRSLQLACDPALVVADGTARERPRSKRTFWSEPKLWRLALPG